MKTRIQPHKGLILLTLLVVIGIVRYYQTQPRVLNNSYGEQIDEHSSTSHSSFNAPTNAIPDYVLNTLNYIKTNQSAPEGYVGGRYFHNREKQLPLKTQGGEWIRYQEWDVHPQKSGTNRGPERLVTGSDGSAWYTNNHYRSFSLIGAP